MEKRKSAVEQILDSSLTGQVNLIAGIIDNAKLALSELPLLGNNKARLSEKLDNLNVSVCHEKIPDIIKNSIIDLLGEVVEQSNKLDIAHCNELKTVKNEYSLQGVVEEQLEERGTMITFRDDIVTLGSVCRDYTDKLELAQKQQHNR